MAVNFRKFLSGINVIPKVTSTVSSAGDLDVTSGNGKLNYHDGTTSSPVMTESSTATMTNKTFDADGTGNSITNIENADIKAAAAIDAAKIANGSVSNTEYQYLDGVTSAIQTQLNSITGSAVTSLTGDVTGTGPGATATTLASVGTAGTYGSVTTDAKGRVTSGSVATPIANGGTGQTTKAAAFDALSPLTTGGDLLYGGASGTGTRLANGSSGQVLTSSGGTAAPVWATAGGAPAGSVIMYSASSAPAGWLLCDGTAVSRITYSALFAIVNTTFGIGDGSTTFNLPHMDGLFPRSIGSQTTGSLTYDGGNVGTQLNDQMQGHRHSSSNTLIDSTARYNTDTGGPYALGRSDIMGIFDPITDTVNGTPRTGTETRPASLSFAFIIKT